MNLKTRVTKLEHVADADGPPGLTTTDRRAFFLGLGQALSEHPDAKAAVGTLMEFFFYDHQFSCLARCPMLKWEP